MKRPWDGHLGHTNYIFNTFRSHITRIDAEKIQHR